MLDPCFPIPTRRASLIWPGRKGCCAPAISTTIRAPRVVLTRLTAAGLLVRVGRELYRLPDAQVSEAEKQRWRDSKAGLPAMTHF